MSVSNSNPSSKPSNVALFTDEATSALKATQEIQDNVHKLLDTFTSWRSLQPEASMSKVKDTIKVIQACQRYSFICSVYQLTESASEVKQS